MSDSEPNPSPQQTEPGTVKKPSLGWAIAISITIFVMLLPFPIESFFIIPKLKIIFVDMLGPDESLPEFTLLALKVSDTLNNNAFILLPVYLIFSLVCAGFVGFQRYFIPRPISIIITVSFILLCLGLFVGPVIAMFLPLIKMMDKLGQ